MSPFPLFLNTLPDLPEDDGDPVELLMARCLAAEPEEGDTALEDACRENPELAGELRERFEALRRVGLDPTAPAGASDGLPERLGDFRLLERIGAGGMGVVYEAEQLSLGRRVALKLVRPENLFFGTSRERFRREVETVARLKHPGIVPVYTVGEERGLPYFAMERIEGGTLAEVLHELGGRAPESLEGSDLAAALARVAHVDRTRVGGAAFEGSWTRACARIARQIAEALAYAHGEGVVHRDVKPSNVALSLDGRAMLLDFGLTPTRGEERITRSGSQVGTLLYMSPEQILSSSDVDGRSDVYSLGATLYEMLALQVPFRERNPVLTQTAILDGRPPSLRARNPRVPTDLETVCLVAMERDAGRRYASARSFARDLERVLELRPIAARPPGAWTRARRWVQRNPALFAASALALLLVGVVPSVLLWMQSAHASDLEAALDERERAHDQAEENLEDALATQHFLAGLFRSAGPQIARGEAVLLVDVLRESLARLRTELGDRPHVRMRVVAELGGVYLEMGEVDAAVELLEGEVARFRELRAAEPGRFVDGDVGRLGLAMVSLAQGWILQGRLDEAEELLRDVLAEVPAADFPQCAAAAHYQLGVRYHREVRHGEAAEELDRALEMLRRSPEAAPHQISAVLDLRSRTSEARDLGEAVEIARELVERSREAFGDEPHLHVAAAHRSLAGALVEVGRHDEAEQHARAALEIVRSIAKEGGRDEMRSLEALAAALRQSEGAAAAIEDYEEAHRIATELLRAGDPELVRIRTNLARVRWEVGRHAEAAELYERVLPEIEALRGEDRVLARALASHGGCLQLAGRHEEARARLRRAVGIHDRAGADPSDLDVLEARYWLAAAHRSLEQHELAEEGYRVVSGATGVAGPAGCELVSRACEELASYAALRRDLEAAAPLLERAIELADRVDPSAPRAYWLRAELGGCLERIDRTEESIALLGDARATAKRDLGVSHAQTLHVTEHLQIALESAGAAERARALEEELLAEIGDRQARFHRSAPADPGGDQ